MRHKNNRFEIIIVILALLFSYIYYKSIGREELLQKYEVRETVRFISIATGKKPAIVVMNENEKRFAVGFSDYLDARKIYNKGQFDMNCLTYKTEIYKKYILHYFVDVAKEACKVNEDVFKLQD